MLALALSLALAAPDPLLAEIRKDVVFFVRSDGAAAAVVAEIDADATKAAERMAPAPQRAALKKRLLQEIRASLAEKRRKKGFALTADEIRETVVAFELFRAEAFVSSGVFPKRYFGYVDFKWDTAPYEKRLRELSTGGAEVANEYLKKRGSTVRVTPMEVVVTFLAEGGAILLREEAAPRGTALAALASERQQAQLNDIHPVFGVGLDDIGEGFEKHAPLIEALDAKFGTGLVTIAKRDGGHYRGTTLSRNFTFDEAVLGTVAMYVFEKLIATRKMKEDDGADIATLPLEEQFVASSLVYNSGLLFAKDRREWIRDFSTGTYLDGVSRNAKQRPRLPVSDPQGSLATLIAKGYPEQPTSWSAVYHVLQRWGAFVALAKFSNAFEDDGTWQAPPD